MTVFVYIVSNKVELNISGKKRATSILPKGLYSFEVIFAMQSREGWVEFYTIEQFCWQMTKIGKKIWPGGGGQSLGEGKFPGTLDYRILN
jgi:hypothetical protein